MVVMVGGVGGGRNESGGLRIHPCNTIPFFSQNPLPLFFESLDESYDDNLNV